MIERFKRDVIYYLIGIIIPGAFNFLSIPVFKQMLGEAAYGQFNLLFTSLMIGNTALVGWIGQSVIRIGMQVSDKKQFAAYSLWVSLMITIPASIVAWIILFNLGLSVWIGVLFAGVLILSSQQVILVSIAQSFFKARLTMVTEALRVSSFFIMGFLLLSLTGNKYGVEKIFLSLFISTLVSSLSLIIGNGLLKNLVNWPVWSKLMEVSSAMFNYGIYLMLWFLLNYAMIYGDRYLIAYYYGNELVGNYTALFDIIARSISLLAAPVLAAIFPILTYEYDKANYSAIEKLIRQVIGVEIVMLIAAVILYSWIGYPFLGKILHIPDNGPGYRLSGALVLAGSIIGQMGMVLHKKLELAKKTNQMLASIIVAFFVGIFLAVILVKPWGIIGTSLSYLVATLTYLGMVSFKTRAWPPGSNALLWHILKRPKK